MYSGLSVYGVDEFLQRKKVFEDVGALRLMICYEKPEPAYLEAGPLVCYPKECVFLVLRQESREQNSEPPQTTLHEFGDAVKRQCKAVLMARYEEALKARYEVGPEPQYKVPPKARCDKKLEAQYGGLIKARYEEMAHYMPSFQVLEASFVDGGGNARFGSLGDAQRTVIARYLNRGEPGESSPWHHEKQQLHDWGGWPP